MITWDDKLSPVSLRQTLLAMPVSVWIPSKTNPADGRSRSRTKLYEVVSVRRTSETEWWVGNTPVLPGDLPWQFSVNGETNGGIEQTISLVISQAKAHWSKEVCSKCGVVPEILYTVQEWRPHLSLRDQRRRLEEEEV